MSTWFEVDRGGLAEIAKRRGMAFIVTEPIQNAWDEATSRVEVELAPVPGVAKARLRVADDSPDGFADMADSYMMFRSSYKLKNPEQRGRFNIGEKLLLAMADEARITSTKGSVIFGPKGRTTGRKKTDAGSILTATLRMTRGELDDALATARTLIPPVPTVVNGETVAMREPVAAGRVSLQTEVQGETGGFRTVYRMTDLRVYEPLDGETPHLYEMGIPVQPVEAPWHIEVMQKVPLTVDRASVSTHYLTLAVTAATELMADEITQDDARSTWASTALAFTDDDEVVRTIIKKRFGKAVTFDPSNPESNKRALDAGWKVVHGGEFTRFQWGAVKRARALKPAGRVFDTGKVETSPDGIPPLDESDWTHEMRTVAEYAKQFAEHTCRVTPRVSYYRVPGNRWAAMCGQGGISFNLSTRGVGSMISGLDQEAIDELLIHECAHFKANDHLTDAFHQECCRIGARARSFDLTLGA